MSYDLVLGGSAGIGFAQAYRLARDGKRLVLVARDPARLSKAAEQLLRLGASEVEVHASNLSDPRERQSLLARLQRPERIFRSIFVSGPSPKSGREDEVSDADHRDAEERCLCYPLAVVKYASSLMQKGGELIIVSSSAATEEERGHPFYLSAHYRRNLDARIAQSRPQLANENIEITILRPKIVMTPLSLNYAYKRGAKSLQQARALLARLFDVEAVPDALEYLDNHMTGPRL